MRQGGNVGRSVEGDAPRSLLGVRFRYVCLRILRFEVHGVRLGPHGLGGGGDSLHVGSVLNRERERLGRVEDVIPEFGGELRQPHPHIVEFLLFLPLETDTPQGHTPERVGHGPTALTLLELHVLTSGILPRRFNALERVVQRPALAELRHGLNDARLILLVRLPQFVPVLHPVQMSRHSPHVPQRLLEALHGGEDLVVRRPIVLRQLRFHRGKVGFELLEEFRHGGGELGRFDGREAGEAVLVEHGVGRRRRRRFGRLGSGGGGHHGEWNATAEGGSAASDSGNRGSEGTRGSGGCHEREGGNGGGIDPHRDENTTNQKERRMRQG
mmetsp:Transcript_25606/g.75574  ORF Transcript_25606/g.75574 Transcript_25606/m.75574 type:complete len:327 (-) Transcript_25606:9-989(-)